MGASPQEAEYDPDRHCTNHAFCKSRVLLGLLRSFGLCGQSSPTPRPTVRWGELFCRIAPHFRSKRNAGGTFRATRAGQAPQPIGGFKCRPRFRRLQTPCEAQRKLLLRSRTAVRQYGQELLLFPRQPVQPGWPSVMLRLIYHGRYCVDGGALLHGKAGCLELRHDLLP